MHGRASTQNAPNLQQLRTHVLKDFDNISLLVYVLSGRTEAFSFVHVVSLNLRWFHTFHHQSEVSCHLQWAPLVRPF